jgi:hypothetical protein
MLSLLPEILKKIRSEYLPATRGSCPLAKALKEYKK